VEIWEISNKKSISVYNSKPVFFELFDQISSDINKALYKSSYPLLGNSYSLHLNEGKMIVIVNLAKYRLGMLIKKTNTNVGLINNIIIPKLIGLFEEIYP